VQHPFAAELTNVSKPIVGQPLGFERQMKTFCEGEQLTVIALTVPSQNPYQECFCVFGHERNISRAMWTESSGLQTSG
jgi:hypothetical protein